MKRYVLLLLWLWLGLGAVWADGVKSVEVWIVSRASDPQMELTGRSLATRVALLAQQSGLSKDQLRISLFDFDQDKVKQDCETNLKIGGDDLPYVGLVGVTDKGKALMFSIKKVDDIEKSAAAAVRTARGLFDTSSTPTAVMPEDPVKQKQHVEFYTWLLKHVDALGFHPDADLVAKEMDSIRTTFVDPISDTQMEAGIVRHVRDLLTAAAQPSDALDHMALDNSLPGRILDTYGAKVDRDALAWAEVEGALDPLDDPHSALLTPAQTKGWNANLQETSTAVVGVSTEVDRKTGQVIILSVTEDGPAAKAGAMPGDVIVRIDDLPTGGFTPELVYNLLRGAVGTTLKLTVRRGEATRDLTITRALVPARTVTSKVLPGDIGYLRLTTFATNSEAEVEGVLIKWKMARIKGAIIDLRNNGGGLVFTAQQLCSLFVAKGELCMDLVGRGGKRQPLLSNGPGDYSTLPLVLLVNAYTASASEMTAGCLKDHKVATLVGVRTYGKGSMQQPFDFPHQTMLKLTIAHWYTPSGAIIDRLGIAPDVDVPMDVSAIGTDHDVQLQKAVEVVQNKIGTK